MATQKAVNGNVQRPQGGIVIPTNYTVPSTSPVTNTNLRTVNASATIVRTTPKDTAQANKILSGGTFANDNGTIVNIATTSIAGGVAEDCLKHMAPSIATNRPINSQPSESFSLVPAAIRVGYWNVYSGVFSTAPTVTVTTWSSDYGTIPSGGYVVRQNEVAYSLGRVPVRTHLGPKTII